MPEENVQNPVPTGGQIAGMTDRSVASNDPRVDKTGQSVSPEAPEAGTPVLDEDANLPEKYRGKSKAEVVQMHQEAEKLIGQRMQDILTQSPEVLSGLESPSTPPPNVPQGYEDYGGTDAENLNAFVNALGDEMEKRVEKVVSPMRFENELNKVKAAYPDFDEYAPKVLQILKDNPELKLIARKQGKNVLDFAYRFAKAQNYEGTINAAIEQGKETAYSTQRQKTTPIIQQQSRSSSPTLGGKPVFTRSQIADRAFYKEHREEIEEANRDGRIIE